MTLTSKRTIFFSLVILFVAYSVIVATTGTSVDKGASVFSPEAAAGKTAYQKYNCNSCHQLYGLGGYMGPDLTNVISAKGKGAEYASAIIKSGTSKMPDLKLSDKEVNEIVSFLTYIDKTGSSPVLDYTIHYDGTVDVSEKK